MRAFVRRFCVCAWTTLVGVSRIQVVCVCMDAFSRRVPYTSGVRGRLCVRVRVRVCTKQKHIYIFIIVQTWLPAGGHDDCWGGQPEDYLPQFPVLTHGRPRPCPEQIKSKHSEATIKRNVHVTQSFAINHACYQRLELFIVLKIRSHYVADLTVSAILSSFSVPERLLPNALGRERPADGSCSSGVKGAFRAFFFAAYSGPPRGSILPVLPLF